jgi:hypothetical protein
VPDHQPRRHRILDAVPGDGTRYGVYVRLDNSPAHPIIQVGWIVLTD